MPSGLFAFAAACVFVGAALYINVVEQPARLALSDRAMLREWALSNRRGFVLLSALAIVSAILAYLHFGATSDVRFMIGGTVMLLSWPYFYFVVLPVNIWLAAVPPDAAGSTSRAVMRDWGLAEWGLTAIGFAACWLFAWGLLWPA